MLSTGNKVGAETNHRLRRRLRRRPRELGQTAHHGACYGKNARIGVASPARKPLTLVHLETNVESDGCQLSRKRTRFPHYSVSPTEKPTPARRAKSSGPAGNTLILRPKTKDLIDQGDGQMAQRIGGRKWPGQRPGARSTLRSSDFRELSEPSIPETPG